MNNTHYDIRSMLQQMVALNASDLHLSAGSAPVMRIHGQLGNQGEEVLTPAAIQAMAKQLLGEERFSTFEQAGEIDFSYAVEDSARYRINIYRQKGGVSLAARRITNEIPTLEQLGLPPLLKNLTEKHQGLILVTGPTGSGKSSTLAAMIGYINNRQSRHIVTLEDPIEYVHTHRRSLVNQREVGSDTASFASGIRAALRQDPDVMLVGEMRDLETISAAVTAAETGHLVLATLHTSDAPQTIDRIIDVFPAHQQGQIRIQLAAVLTAIISQRLLPTVDSRGRACATEILINTPAIANLIRTEKTHQIRSMMQTGRSSGMHTLEMSIRDLIQSGRIDPVVGKLYLPEVSV
ncbi:type IV pilus twitching motility protein PilT [Paenibacillus bovis]|uniref:Type IV pili twitching motility protein PilT n=1 Tax=Paenibacillus bovis TaxID=1616788 RepID=A0A172ZDX7_9BACL|nr:type IV pilus twitching motility protein PilT [Paenibacillus bovis]ANF95739.1 type IV pili twitching motility protein PilT [Paenibacillus bovis]